LLANNLYCFIYVTFHLICTCMVASLDIKQVPVAESTRIIPLRSWEYEEGRGPLARPGQWATAQVTQMATAAEAATATEAAQEQESSNPTSATTTAVAVAEEGKLYSQNANEERQEQQQEHQQEQQQEQQQQQQQQQQRQEHAMYAVGDSSASTTVTTGVSDVHNTAHKASEHDMDSGADEVNNGERKGDGPAELQPQQQEQKARDMKVADDFLDNVQSFFDGELCVSVIF
jgi:hypothetical protein